MQEAERVLHELRGQGFEIHMITGDVHWILFARRGGEEWSVRGDDLLRVSRALAVAVGARGDGADAAWAERSVTA